MRKRNMIFAGIVILIFLIAPPILAPLIHDNHSPVSAIRNYLQKEGHPYQGFFAVISSKNIGKPSTGCCTMYAG